MNGRVGGARCDWNELAFATRDSLALGEFQTRPGLATSYIQSMPDEEQRSLVYGTLGILARKAGSSVATEADRVKIAIGKFRWNLNYVSQDSVVR